MTSIGHCHHSADFCDIFALLKDRGLRCEWPQGSAVLELLGYKVMTFSGSKYCRVDFRCSDATDVFKYLAILYNNVFIGTMKKVHDLNEKWKCFTENEESVLR